MTTCLHCSGPSCGRVSRRTFLADLGMGFTGLALGAMLHRDGSARAEAAASGRPLMVPRAKSVIWIFLSGGYSHLETFDPKPALNRYSGMTYAQAPVPNPQRSPLFLQRSRSVVGMDRDLFSRIYPLQVGFRKHGQCGADVSHWLPNLAGCVADIPFVRSRPPPH